MQSCRALLIDLIICTIGWPDSSSGLLALKEKYLIAVLANGNVRLHVDMVCEGIYSLACILIMKKLGKAC